MPIGPIQPKKPVAKFGAKPAPAQAANQPLIKPPTKAQIQAAKGAVKGDGATVVNAANLNNLLGKKPDKEFENEAPLDLTNLQAPQVINNNYNNNHNENSYQQFQQQPSYNNNHNNQQQNDFSSNQNYQNQHQQNQHQQNQHSNNQQEQPLSQAPYVRKKPSEMTPEEYAVFEKQREESNWKRLVDINVWRTPSTFEKNECLDLLKQNQKFAQMYNAEMSRKQQQDAMKPQKQQRQEQLKPEVKRTDQGKFNPTYEPTLQVPQILEQTQNQLQNGDQYHANNQQISQQQQQLQFLQQQMLQMQTQQVQLPQLPINPNQHLLQNVQDIQIELQITQQQASKHQMEVYRLERENGLLKSEIQQEKQLRQNAEFRAAEMAVDLEALRAQICDLRDKLQRATFGVNVQDATPITQNQLNMQYQQQIAPQNTFVKPAVGNDSTKQQQVQQNSNQVAIKQKLPPTQQQAVQKEDPNFNTLALNDIEQIMKNANIVLNKYQDYDQSLNNPAGRQVKQAYKNLMNNGQNQQQNQQNQQLKQQQEEKRQYEDDIENLLTNDDNMNTIEMNQAPTDIPASILNQIPDMDENMESANVYEANPPQSGQKQYQQEVDEYRTEHVGSLLPKSKYNSRDQALRK